MFCLFLRRESLACSGCDDCVMADAGGTGIGACLRLFLVRLFFLNSSYCFNFSRPEVAGWSCRHVRILGLCEMW